jgi:hypothetical protein
VPEGAGTTEYRFTGCTFVSARGVEAFRQAAPAGVERVEMP